MVLNEKSSNYKVVSLVESYNLQITHTHTHPNL
jgi:hypothetical protein